MTSRENYTSEWQVLGYPNGMASSEFLPPPAKGFVRAYHFTSSQHAINAVGLGRLKVARFSDANDPFELLGLNCHDRRTRKRAAKLRDEYNSRTGLLSFTRNWSSPLIWSHYADRHKGICLGFNVRRAMIKSVKYEDERLRKELPENPDRTQLSSKLQERLAVTKSHHWKYEEELRLFVELKQTVRERDLFFQLFSDDLQLAEVILGDRCEHALPTVRRLVFQVAPDAVAFKARLAFRSFEVRLNGKTKPHVSQAA